MRLLEPPDLRQHGSGDDNVHYQNTEVLVNALVAADRPFQMMEYPNRTHGMREGGARRHLFSTIARFLDDRLGRENSRGALSDRRTGR